MHQLYRPQHAIRIVTAASLFDGHDAAINIMRRIIQSTGVEVIHLGHNRTAEEIVNCAIQEDVQGIAITSYQGGHVEFFKYIYDLLKERQSNIKIFGGGGGTILPQEIEELHAYGITKIYSPDDGRQLGLQGMINELVEACDFDTTKDYIFKEENLKNHDELAKSLTWHENLLDKEDTSIDKNTIPVLGITGTGGAGKSSLTDEIIRRFLDYSDLRMAILTVDPTKKKTGGALLGDRIRMNSVHSSRIFMRSFATRHSNNGLSSTLPKAIQLCQKADFDIIIIETSGIGQSDSEITSLCDLSLYVMTSEYGAATQLEKIDMLDFADAVAINKFDKRGSLDALRDVRKQYQRNHQLWETSPETLPIFGTIASQFNNQGVNELYNFLASSLSSAFPSLQKIQQADVKHEQIFQHVLPPDKVRYLSEIASYNRQYGEWVLQEKNLSSQLYQLKGSKTLLDQQKVNTDELDKLINGLEDRLDKHTLRIIEKWDDLKDKYTGDFYEYTVRNKVHQQNIHNTTLSGTKIPKVSLPTYSDWGDIVEWRYQENLPGRFPYTAGVFPLKRTGEDPARMFAGEGTPERTNKRFHFLSEDMKAKRLSTAFDSVTLYGENPAVRPDIYGKIGNSGVNIATVNDAKKLYSGFDLIQPYCSVSMTINGPAPILLAFFLNAAVDQQCEKYITENHLEGILEKKLQAKFEDKGLKRPVFEGELPRGNNGLGLKMLGLSGDEVLPLDVYNEIKSQTLKAVRGTVQADILKEDQAQNTCIFSTEFALKMMGDIQAYFIEKEVRNFYSVSISGYHIAEAGANPITQLAFTLANGFTYIEYYLSRGMDINDFAPNLSFFFSNGIDAEYAVIGRVARRIWSKALKHRYGANERSQKLKYHIQTSGRSLHAQEIAFNDIRTTLQALYAIYDNCNSLHTNAYDEAITTPTEESVRRALAIQHIINQELGLSKNENPLQGSFIIEELTDLVEEAVLTEFDKITERGGVLGAMERMYQRSKIQEESMLYEQKKHDGELPIIGVNTFLNKKGSPTIIPDEVIRSTKEEKEWQISNVQQFQLASADESDHWLHQLTEAAKKNQNTFEVLMEAAKYCSIGQITHSLFNVGGKYRRNM